MDADAELLDPAFLDRLRALVVKLRRRRRQRKQGAQQTPVSGHTREFKDRRHYAHGDDYRSIDWRLYARLDRMMVRVFEEVQEFHVHILLDRSASMQAPHAEKRRDALRLAVALGYLTLAGGHRLSLHTLGGGDCRRELPPLKGQGHVHSLIRHAVRIPFGGPGDLGAALGRFRAGGDRRGMVFILSDLLGGDPDATQDALRCVRSWPAESHIVHLLHPLELDPGHDGEVRLADVETGELRRLWLTAADLARYRARIAGWREALRAACAGWQVDWCAWDTQQPFEDQFVGFLARADALAGR